ncbi:MAG: universal stress protein [Ignavibacteriae bacterium]|nr:universal stress protein [Ignavibacteriota bacterium]
MELSTSRPRVLGWLRSAAILDGDWGTSICYVLGIAFFHAGYYSGWHLMMMLVFTTIIAFNYITICRLYPNGGGVYSSVSHRSRTLAVVGALLLSADYVITASLSVLDACHYLALEFPEGWAIGIILCIGVLNWFGPRHAGTVAIAISAATLLGLLVLLTAVFPTAARNINLQPAPGGLLPNWHFFVAIILSISGIEAISNMTGLMKNPAKDSRRAIFAVLTKISFATIILGFAMLAIPSLSPETHKEEMIRYLGEYYVGGWFGPIIGFALGFLLISAGNTALNDLVSIQFLMSVDGELPSNLRRLNKYGVPVIPLFVAIALPIIILLLIHDVITLSALYAIGVVGAIMINVGSTGTDRSLQLKPWSRFFMLASAALLFFIETTIAIEKTKALAFASSVLFIGLSARAIAKRQRLAMEAAPPVAAAPAPAVSAVQRPEAIPFTSRMLVAVRGGGERLLRQACEDAKRQHAFLFVLNIKQVSVAGILPEKMPAESFVDNQWMDTICREYTIPFKVISILSPEICYTISEQAATLGVDRVVLGSTQRSLVEQALRGDVIRSVSELLPEEIQLSIYRA